MPTEPHPDRSPVQAHPIPRIRLQAIRANADHGFVYLNNPKVGCSTVKGSLWQAIRGEPPPQRAGGVHRLEGSPFTNNLETLPDLRHAYIFSFVRNPFQRLVSAYLNKVVTQSDLVWSGFAERRGLDPKAPISLDGFVELLSGVAPEENDPHWRLQHLNLLHPFVRPNLLADLGMMDQFLPNVLARVFPEKGDAQPVTQMRKHATSTGSIWRDHLTDKATVQRLVDMYAVDFEVYGYRTDVTADPAPIKPPILSDHRHEGLQRLAEFLAAPQGSGRKSLQALEDADSEGALADWILAQRLRMAENLPQQKARLLAENAERVAQGPAYMRKLA